MRGQAEATLLTDVAEVRRRGTVVDDGMGGGEGTVATVATVACHLQQRDVAPESVAAGRIMARSTWEVYLPVGTDVRPRDVLRISGSDYELGDDDDDRTSGVVLKVHARRVG